MATALRSEKPTVPPKLDGSRRTPRRRHDPGLHVGADLIARYIEYRLDPSNDVKNQHQQAADLGVSRSSISNLARIPGVLDEVRRQRYAIRGEDLLRVDEAIFRAGAEGVVPAAKLCYERWDAGYKPRRVEVRVDPELERLKGMSTEELEAEAQRITDHIKWIQSTVDALVPPTNAQK